MIKRNTLIIHQPPHNPSGIKELAEQLSATQHIPVQMGYWKTRNNGRTDYGTRE